MGITVHVYCERGHRYRVVDEFQMCVGGVGPTGPGDRLGHPAGDEA